MADRRTPRAAVGLAALVAAALVACAERPAPAPSGDAPTLITTTSAPDGRAPGSAGAPAGASGPGAPAALQPLRPGLREGGALARSGAALWLADEDHGAVRRIVIAGPIGAHPATPDPGGALEVEARMESFPMPGRPAQVLPLGDRVIVSVRDPGLLLVIDEHGRETLRTSVPDDAWGLALSVDGRTAFVTSAWTHRVTAVDLAAGKVRWSVDVAREPRGIAATADAVYVSHLVGAALTRIEGAAGSSPRVSRVDLPPSPARTPLGAVATASLGYAAILAPDGRRLYVARHGLGLVAHEAWQGVPTVDVLSTPSSTPVAPPAGAVAAAPPGRWVQPRALAYLRRSDRLLVAGEGASVLAELDALSVEPAITPLRLHDLGGPPPAPPAVQVPPRCGAPTGIALSDDETVAWVFCRTTDNLAAVSLHEEGAPDPSPRDGPGPPRGPRADEPLYAPGPFAFVRLAPAPEPTEIALGRRLFYDAVDPVVSGGAGCAACHPEGRDDGFVWHELTEGQTQPARRTLVHTPALLVEVPGLKRNPGASLGYPRQTPTLVGRVDAYGPYGWRGESEDLVARIKAGFLLHRWWPYDLDAPDVQRRARPLAAYLRRGLVPPPARRQELSAVERRGRELFSSPATRCASCHPATSDYSDRSLWPIAKPVPPRDFEPEGDVPFKVPSLRHVGSTPPYFHDGRYVTLEELIEQNDDRMGRTRHLSSSDRAALIAFLRTL